METNGCCLCGTLKFVIKGKLENAVHCHCPMCRKAQGGAFTSNATYSEADFEWKSNTKHLRTYESSKGTFRCFCSHCGSPIYKYSESVPGVYRIRLGVLDDDIEIKPTAHIHVLHKVHWYTINDTLRRFESSVSEGKGV